LKKFAANPNKFINEWVIQQTPILKKQQLHVDHKTFYDPVVQQTIFEMMQSYK